MTTVTIFVPKDIATKCEEFMAVGSISSVKKGVEMLLTNNLYIEGCSATPGTGQRDVSALLKKGLTILSNSPHEALGVSVGAKTQEIRKAYKKNALQYHPDKNPLTTPLFQVIHAAHEKLSDRDVRAREESKAAAASRPTGHPTQPGGRQPATGAKGNSQYEQYRSQYAQDSAKQPQSNMHTKYSQPQPQAQPQASSTPQYQNNFYSQDEATRKARYEEFIRDQQKKADSDKRAKEYADAARARQQAQAQQPDPASYRRDAEARQREKYASEINARRDEILKQAAAAQAAQNAYQNSGPGYNSSRAAPNAAPTSSNPAAGAAAADKDVYRRRTYEGNGPAAQPTQPAAQAQNPNLRSFKPNAIPGGGSGATDSASAAAANAGAKNPYYSYVYPSNLNGQSASAAPGSKVPPINIPSKPTAGTAAAGAGAGGYSNSYAGIYGDNTARSDSGNAGNYSARSTTSTGSSSIPSVYSNVNYKYAAHEAANTSAKNTPVPRPYGLKCTSVGTTLLELEWNTSLTYKNILVVELCWRYLGGNTLIGTNARQTWESANKLIGSGKCRKKNLIAGGQYEFRVRAVEELVGGMLGQRSEWSESVTIALVQPHAGRESGNTNAKTNVETATDKALNKAKQNTSAAADTKASAATAGSQGSTYASSGSSYSYVGAKIQEPIYHNPVSATSSATTSASSSASNIKQATPPATQAPPAASTFQRFSPKLTPEPIQASAAAASAAGSISGYPNVGTSAAQSATTAAASTNKSPATATNAASSGVNPTYDKTQNRHYYAPIAPSNSNATLPTAANVTPAAVHKFTTLDANNKESTPPVATTSHNIKVIPAAVIPTATPTGTQASAGLRKTPSKSVLSSSAREAWGKDSIQLEPQTPPSKNMTHNNKGSYNRGNINRSRISPPVGPPNNNPIYGGVPVNNKSGKEKGDTTTRSEQYEVDEEIEYSSDDDEEADAASVDEDELNESTAAARAQLHQSAINIKQSFRNQQVEEEDPEIIPDVADDEDEDGNKYNLREVHRQESRSNDEEDVIGEQSDNENYTQDDDDDDEGFELHGVDSSSASVDINMGIAYKQKDAATAANVAADGKVKPTKGNDTPICTIKSNQSAGKMSPAVVSPSTSTSSSVKSGSKSPKKSPKKSPGRSKPRPVRERDSDDDTDTDEEPIADESSPTVPLQQKTASPDFEIQEEDEYVDDEGAEDVYTEKTPGKSGKKSGAQKSPTKSGKSTVNDALASETEKLSLEVPAVGKSVTAKDVSQVQAQVEVEAGNGDTYSEDEEDDFEIEEEQYYELFAPPTTDNSALYKHTVRAEPFMKSKQIGYLLNGFSILAIADCGDVGSSRVDLQACKLEYSIVSPK